MTNKLAMRELWWLVIWLDREGKKTAAHVGKQLQIMAAQHGHRRPS
jgi:hypothetical protein